MFKIFNFLKKFFSILVVPLTSFIYFIKIIFRFNIINKIPTVGEVGLLSNNKTIKKKEFFFIIKLMLFIFRVKLSESEYLRLSANNNTNKKNINFSQKKKILI